MLARELAPAIDERITREGESINAPHLLDLEVAQVLRRYDRLGLIEPARAAEALVDFGGLDVTRYPHTLLLGRVWELRANLTAYDAVYIALAEILEAPLVTIDARLARTPGHSVTVEVIGQPDPR